MTPTPRTTEFFQMRRTHQECEKFAAGLETELTAMTAERDALIVKLQEAREWSSKLADAGDDLRAERDDYKARLENEKGWSQ